MRTIQIDGKVYEVRPENYCYLCNATSGFVYMKSLNLKVCNDGHAPVFIDHSLKKGQKSIMENKVGE